MISPVSFSSDTTCYLVVGRSDTPQETLSPSRLQKTPSIPVVDAPVAPIQVEAHGRISQKCIGQSLRDITRCFHREILLYTAALSCNLPSCYCPNVCFNWLNMLVSPAMVGTVLQRTTKSLCQRQRDHLVAAAGMERRNSSIFSFLSTGNMRRRLDVSKAKPNTTLRVLQHAYHFRRFLRDIGSFRATNYSFLGGRRCLSAEKGDV